MKFIKLGLVFSFSIQLAFAASFENYVVSNLNLDYFYPFGEGSVSSIMTRELSLPGQTGDYAADVIYADGTYSLSFGSPLVKWNDVPMVKQEYDQFILRDFYWNQQQQNLSISMGYLYTQKLDSYNDIFTKIQNLEMRCLANDSVEGKKPLEGLYFSCTKNARVSLQIMKTEVKGKRFSYRSADSFEMRNLNFTVSNHRVQGSVNIEEAGRASVKFSGRSDYIADKKYIRIRVDSVKVGFFNITSKFFNLIEGLQTEKMKVDAPYIYFYTDPEGAGPGIEF